MKYRILMLLVLAATLGAQDKKDANDEAVLRVYDLDGLAVRPVRWYTGDFPPPMEHEFALLGAPETRDNMPEDDAVEADAFEPADMVVNCVRAFLGDVEGIFAAEAVDDGRRLLARAKPEDQAIIARIVEKFREAGDPPVEIAVRRMSFPDRALDDSTRAMLLAPAKLGDEQLLALAKLDVHGGRQQGMLEVPVGRWGVFRATREIRYVPDFNAEIAQAASIADPVPARAADGVKAAVRPFVMSDGRLLLRVVASAGDRADDLRRFMMGPSEVRDELRIRTTDYGEVEQSDYRGAAVSTEAVVVVGQPAVVVLSSSTGSDVRWDVLALTVAAAPKAPPADTFVIQPVGALTAEDSERSLRWSSGTGELMMAGSEKPVERLPLDDLVDLLGRSGFPAEQEGEFRTGAADLCGGCVLLRGSAADVSKAGQAVATLERELIRPARLAIVLTVDRPGQESRTAGILASPMTVGRKAALAAYARMDTIGDYDVEVAQESRIADPNLTIVTAGSFANADLSQLDDGTYRLRLDLTVAGAPQGIQTSSARAGGVPPVQCVPLSKCVAPIRADLVAGRPRTFDLGPDPFSSTEGGRIRATVTVESQ
jgi:hypothetical protein